MPPFERSITAVRKAGLSKALSTLWIMIALAVMIRLVFLGILDLLPEEAYYWSYAQHLDIGYLDHPPMVAWLNYLAGAIVGKSEFAVRLPAFLGWFILAYFMFRVAEETVGKGTGKAVVLLLAVLPIYLSVGFLMTPDAPLYVCWAGALYFLMRAVFNKQTSGWYAAGVFLGLGLLSKYTMGLILPAAVVYMLMDKDARRWFKSPHPYLGLLLGLALFSPVLYWNSQHHWVSFEFQGTHRWAGGMNFNLHILIGSILVLITPLGLYEAVRVLQEVVKNRLRTSSTDLLKHRKQLFLATFALVPLTVFVIHSVQGQPKLNWTGPVWLSLLPLIGERILSIRRRHDGLHVPSLQGRWRTAAVSLLVVFAAGFSYAIAGMPGITKENGMKFPIAWSEYGNRVEAIEHSLEDSTKSEPIMIGLDQYWLASQASFYDPDDSGDVEILPETGGENLVGGDGLMWNSWVSPESALGRNAVLLSFTDDKLSQKTVTDHFSVLGDINREVLTNGIGEIGHFYWRVGYNYH